MRLSPEFSAGRHIGPEHRRAERSSVGPSGRSRGLLPRPTGSGAGGHGSDRQCAVVRRAVGGAGTRIVGGRCRPYSSLGGTPAEDRCPGRRPPVAVDVAGRFSADWGTLAHGARSAAVVTDEVQKEKTHTPLRTKL